MEQEKEFRELENTEISSDDSIEAKDTAETDNGAAEKDLPEDSAGETPEAEKNEDGQPEDTETAEEKKNSGLFDDVTTKKSSRFDLADVLKRAGGLWYYAVPAAAVMVITLLNFYVYKAWPFGNGTVAWCDMTQQTVPLLTGLKDILTGKQGVFMNYANAGGMNLWAVVFFFLASPFSLLVLFVKKTQMIVFANILVMLKLMTAGVTSMVYFKHCQKKLPNEWAMIFSVMYAVSGYPMMYFQNIIWLDMMYLFPLLLTSFKYLLEKRRLKPYVAVITIMMIVNYYISYMVVLFILLFMGIVTLRYRKDKRYEHGPVDFVTGSFVAALLSAVVWLPSFLQYLSSGRTESFMEELKNKGFFASYQTTLPTVMHSVLVIVIVVSCLLDGRPRSKKLNTYLILLFLTFIPLYVEPINLMWHTGSYMSFPSRYGFMTQYIFVICAAMFISDDKYRKPKKNKLTDHKAVIIAASLIVYLTVNFYLSFVRKYRDELSKFTNGLWGNDKSFHLIIEIDMILAAVITVFYLCYRKGLLSKQLLALFMAVFAAVECYSNETIYLTMPIERSENRAVDQQTVMDLSDRIKDDSGFYRVRTVSNKKMFDINLVGAMGYNSISHYTSLTDEDYMFMMKKLGYSSYWMEVGSYGSTELVDALFSMKYEIVDNAGAPGCVYSNEKYSIIPTESYLPLGVVIPEETKPLTMLPDVTRGELQQHIYENSIGAEGEQIITFYDCDDERLGSEDGGKYRFSKGDIMTYTVDVKGRQTLYFDCFDAVSNSLNEPINKSFKVRVDGRTIQGEYPTKGSNGLVKLGTYEDERVTVVAEVLQDVSCKSYGVFSLDLDMLDAAVDRAQTVNFKQKGGKLTGDIDAHEGQRCLLTIPYTEQLTIKINGRNADYERIFDDLVVVELKEGTNKITVGSSPKGFGAGLLMTIIGIGVCVLFRFKSKVIREKLDEVANTASTIVVIGAAAVIIVMVYIVPVYVTVSAGMKK